MPKGGRGRPRKESIPVEEAEFFKVFLPHLCSDKLRIPTDFVKDFSKTIRERIVLKVASSSKAWQVGVEKNENGVFLSDGWMRFVSDHLLNAGDFLVFKYNRCYTFMVKIFGINGCKKDLFVANDITATHIKIEDSKEEIQETQPRRRSLRHRT